jgi:hypothetical protein
MTETLVQRANDAVNRLLANADRVAEQARLPYTQMVDLIRDQATEITRLRELVGEEDDDSDDAADKRQTNGWLMVAWMIWLATMACTFHIQIYHAAAGFLHGLLG